jgi:hypothetical protein
MKSGNHKVRCRRCGVRFETQPKEAAHEVDVEPEIGPNDQSDLSSELDLATQSGKEPEIRPEQESAIGVDDLKIEVSDHDLPFHREPLPPVRSEPWFYGFLDGWGTFYLYAAVITFIVAFAGLVTVIVNAKMELGGVSVVIIIISLVVAAVFGTFLVTCAAVIFLIVDQARNVRRLHDLAERIDKG